MVTPVFLLSLPRSGSTMVQRVLSLHPMIATVAEPWILLPLFYMRRELGTRAEYGQKPAYRAISEFLRGLPDGRRVYQEAVGAFAERLYRSAADGHRYFLDKTPRYHLIAAELMECFPTAKFIILWRNPLAVAASMITTFGKGRLRIGDYFIDLQSGPKNLVAACRAHESRVCMTSYEQLALKNVVEWERVFRYLELEFDYEFLSSIDSARLQGAMGDQIGTTIYQSVSAEPLSKWQEVLVGRVRKQWAKSLIEAVGHETLAYMGYDANTLKRELASLSGRRPDLIFDNWDLSAARLRAWTKRNVLDSFR